MIETDLEAHLPVHEARSRIPRRLGHDVRLRRLRDERHRSTEIHEQLHDDDLHGLERHRQLQEDGGERRRDEGDLGREVVPDGLAQVREQDAAKRGAEAHFWCQTPVPGVTPVAPRRRTWPEFWSGDAQRVRVR